MKIKNSWKQRFCVQFLHEKLKLYLSTKDRNVPGLCEHSLEHNEIRHLRRGNLNHSNLQQSNDQFKPIFPQNRKT